MRKSNKILVYLYLLPSLSIIATFAIYPVFRSLCLSLYSWDGMSLKATWVGLANYIRLSKDPIFWVSIKNNLYFIIPKIIIQIPFAFFLAILLDRKIKGYKLWGLLWFFPMMVSESIAGILWTRIFYPDGLLNALLSGIGLNILTRNWLGDPQVAIFALIQVDMWQTVGFSMILFLTALKGIDKSMYEAAAMEGATFLQTIWYVVIPMIKSVTISIILITMIFIFQKFAIIWVMTFGGPMNATQVLSTYMYFNAFRKNWFGYGSAIATVLLLLAFIIIMLTRICVRED